MMGKGRKFAPNKAIDGNWFKSRCPDCQPDPSGVTRENATNTGSMLNAPFNPVTSYYPPVPPPVFQERQMTNATMPTPKSFSSHDNRHDLQTTGEYFGTGQNRTVGKRMGRFAEQRSQYTEPDFLTHYSRILTEYDYSTIYNDNYRRCPNSTCEYLAERRPRFPRIYPCPPPPVCCSSQTWAESDHCTRSTTDEETVCQQPFPQNTEKWKYSYHGLPRVYPCVGKIRRKDPFPAWDVRGTSAKSCGKLSVECRNYVKVV